MSSVKSDMRKIKSCLHVGDFPHVRFHRENARKRGRTQLFRIGTAIVIMYEA